MEYISILIMPLIIILIIGYGLIKRERVFDTFLDGAKQGIETTIKIIPSIIGIMVAIGVFNSSGLMDIITSFISPITNFFGIPRQVAPLALMRPISGSASLGMLNQVLQEFDANSTIGKIASCIMGCTETTFYTIAVYFGAVGIKNTRYVLPVALIADLIAIVVVCNLIR